MEEQGLPPTSLCFCSEACGREDWHRHGQVCRLLRQLLEGQPDASQEQRQPNNIALFSSPSVPRPFLSLVRPTLRAPFLPVCMSSCSKRVWFDQQSSRHMTRAWLKDRSPTAGSVASICGLGSSRKPP
jgi:hypothetical protein